MKMQSIAAVLRSILKYQRQDLGGTADDGSRQLAVSLFGNTQIGNMRNTYEHQRVSDGKIQITILILRRGPCLPLGTNFESPLLSKI